MTGAVKPQLRDHHILSMVSNDGGCSKTRCDSMNGGEEQWCTDQRAIVKPCSCHRAEHLIHRSVEEAVNGLSLSNKPAMDHANTVDTRGQCRKSRKRI